MPTRRRVRPAQCTGIVTVPAAVFQCGGVLVHRTCYSIDIGPRIHDMPLKDIVDIMLKVNAGAYSFEASNPRHEHEYHVWETVRLPESKEIITGVISTTTNLVDTPDMIADGIMCFA